MVESRLHSFHQRKHTAESKEASEDNHSVLIARLFNEHNESLIRFLAMRLHSEQEAKEVAQEAYVRLLSLDSPGAVSFLRAFLFKTAANLAIDRIRSRTRQTQSLEFGLFDEFREVPTPDREVAGLQEIEILQRLVGELPPKCRRAFVLHRVHGLEFADIGKKMGLSERMIRVYVMRALLYCRAGLEAARGQKEPL